MARYTTQALAQNGVIAETRCLLRHVRFIYTGTVVVKFYIHIYDSLTVPADGTVPKIVLAGTGNSTIDQTSFLDLSGPGLEYPASFGLAWALSSTLATKTQVASNLVWLEAIYA